MSWRWLPRKAFLITCDLPAAQVLDALERRFEPHTTTTWWGKEVPYLDFERGDNAFRIDKSFNNDQKPSTELICVGSLQNTGKVVVIRVDYAVYNSYREGLIWMFAGTVALIWFVCIAVALKGKENMADALPVVLALAGFSAIPFLNRWLWALEIDTLHRAVVGVLQKETRPKSAQ